jgi:hypothetical protein
LSSDRIEPEAYSVLNPNDLVYYDIDVKRSENWGIDPGPGADIPDFKGWIIRRVDLVRDIDIGWDWRYITCNCCKFDLSPVPLYSPATTYSRKALVRSNAGKLYYSTNNGNLNNALTNTTWWLQFSDASSEANTFYPTNEIGTYGGLQTLQTVFGYSLSPILSSRTQLTTFPNASSTDIKNIKIISGNNNVFLSDYVQSCNIGSSFSYNLIYGTVGSGRSFEGNILGDGCHSNIIGYSFFDNNIGDDFRYNTTVGYRASVSPAGVENCIIGNLCENNHFNQKFQNNEIKNTCNENIFGLNVEFNIINNICNNNIFASFCNNNSIENLFENNILNTGFVFNTIFNTCNNNTIGNTFAYNRIGNNFSNNTIGDSASNNIFNDDFSFNNIQSNCFANNFGSFCGNNIFGSSFATNTIGYQFTNNTIGSNVNNNKFGNSIDSLNIGNNFAYTVIEDAITNINFASATHVYNNYSKNIFNNAASIARLSYYNTTDQLVVTDPES